MSILGAPLYAPVRDFTDLIAHTDDRHELYFKCETNNTFWYQPVTMNPYKPEMIVDGSNCTEVSSNTAYKQGAVCAYRGTPGFGTDSMLMALPTWRLVEPRRRRYDTSFPVTLFPYKRWSQNTVPVQISIFSCNVLSARTVVKLEPGVLSVRLRGDDLASTPGVALVTGLNTLTEGLCYWVAAEGIGEISPTFAWGEAPQIELPAPQHTYTVDNILPLQITLPQSHSSTASIEFHHGSDVVLTLLTRFSFRAFQAPLALDALGEDLWDVVQGPKQLPDGLYQLYIYLGDDLIYRRPLRVDRAPFTAKPSVKGTEVYMKYDPQMPDAQKAFQYIGRAHDVAYGDFDWTKGLVDNHQRYYLHQGKAILQCGYYRDGSWFTQYKPLVIKGQALSVAAGSANNGDSEDSAEIHTWLLIVLIVIVIAIAAALTYVIYTHG